MTDSWPIYLIKAEESLRGAESEFAQGRYNNAANRCYYACFQAAVAALHHANIVSRAAPSTPPWDARSPGPEEAIRRMESRVADSLFIDSDLMLKREDMQGQRAAGAKQ
jgi:hypothetical protein